MLLNVWDFDWDCKRLNIDRINNTLLKQNHEALSVLYSDQMQQHFFLLIRAATISQSKES